MISSVASEDLKATSGFKVYYTRWIALGFYFTLTLTNSMLWVSFASIFNITQNFFGDNSPYASNTAINMLANVFLVFYPVGTIIATFVMKKYKLRKALLLAAVMTSLGCFLRLAGAFGRDSIGAGGSYALFFLGQCCAAIIQPIFINYPPTIAAVWFPLNERDIATSIGAVSNPIGNALGQLLPVFIVTQSERPDGTYIIKGMTTLMLIEFIINVFPCILAFFFVEDCPPTPPSKSTSVRRVELRSLVRTRSLSRAVLPATPPPTVAMGDVTSGVNNAEEGVDDENVSLFETFLSVADDILHLTANTQFLLLLTTMTLVLGIFSAFFTMLYQIISKYDYNNTDSGLLGFIVIIVGVVGTVLIGPIMRKTRAYRTLLQCLVTGVVLSFLLTLFMLFRNNFGALAFGISLLGLTVLPSLPVMMENCAETCYPLSEELATGLIFSCSNIFGLIYVFIVQSLLSVSDYSASPFTSVNIVMFFTMALSLVFVFLYRGDYQRMQRDLQHSNTTDVENRETATANMTVDNPLASAVSSSSASDKLK